MPDDHPPLIEGLRAWEALDRDTTSLLPYAELLRELVYRRLYPTPGTDLNAPSTDALFDTALRTVLERMIEEQLASLTASQLASLYRAVAGDDVLAEKIRRLSSLEQAELDRRVHLAELRTDARVAGRLRLAALATDETLLLGLFDPGHPELAAYRFRDNQQYRPLHRVWQVRLLDPMSGSVEIVRDSWTGPIWAEQLHTPDAIAPMTPGLLGCGGADQAALTLHARVLLRSGSTVLNPPQLLGYVQTLDGTLLLDG